MSLEAWGDEGLVGPDGYVTEERAEEMVQEATAELQDIIREMLAELETVEYDSDPPDRVLRMLERARAAVNKSGSPHE